MVGTWVVKRLKWAETSYMSLQYIFNANNATFTLSTFTCLFDSSILQCTPVEYHYMLHPNQLNMHQRKSQYGEHILVNNIESLNIMLRPL